MSVIHVWVTIQSPLISEKETEQTHFGRFMMQFD